MTNNILQSIKNTYLGFTSSKTPAQKVKAENVLDSLIRTSEGVVMTNKEWIYSKLQKGAYPAIEENYSYYSSRTNSMTKPKTLYKIEWQQVNHNNSIDTVYNEINKTLYDFACHIVNNDFLNPAILEQFLTQEQQAAEQAKQEEEARIEQEKQAEERYQQWLNEQIQTYNNIEKVELYKAIFNDAFPDQPATDRRAKQFCVYLDNIHIPQCRESLKKFLWYGNKTSKKAFFHLTGIKLPSTDKETMPLLDTLTVNDYQGLVPFKSKVIDNVNNQNNNEKLETFYVYDTKENTFNEVQAKKVEYKGITGFIYSNVVYEANSGLIIARKQEDKTLLQSFKAVIDQREVEKVKQVIQRAINQNGGSPFYKMGVKPLCL